MNELEAYLSFLKLSQERKNEEIPLDRFKWLLKKTFEEEGNIDKNEKVTVVITFSTLDGLLWDLEENGIIDVRDENGYKIIKIKENNFDHLSPCIKSVINYPIYEIENKIKRIVSNELDKIYEMKKCLDRGDIRYAVNIALSQCGLRGILSNQKKSFLIKYTIEYIENRYGNKYRELCTRGSINIPSDIKCIVVYTLYEMTRGSKGKVMSISTAVVYKYVQRMLEDMKIPIRLNPNTIKNHLSEIIDYLMKRGIEIRTVKKSGKIGYSIPVEPLKDFFKKVEEYSKGNLSYEAWKEFDDKIIEYSECLSKFGDYRLASAI